MFAFTTEKLKYEATVLHFSFAVGLRLLFLLLAGYGLLHGWHRPNSIVCPKFSPLPLTPLPPLIPPPTLPPLHPPAPPIFPLPPSPSSKPWNGFFIWPFPNPNV